MTHVRGVTLIELVITIALTGILAALGAVFIKPAVDSYFAQQRRAEIADAADGALRRMARDIRLALPNSVRTRSTGGSVYLEVLLTRTGGRYRSEPDDGTVPNEDPLVFSAADNQFDTLGPLSALPGQTIVAGSDRVVIHNLGISGADAYAGDNSALINTFTSPSGAAAGEDRILLSAAKLFPLESPGRRFQVISGPVSYQCTPGAADASGNGTGTLQRHSGYPIAASQPPPFGGGVTDLLSSYVTACDLQYTTLALQSRGLVALRIALTRGGETVTLYHEVHVNNVP